MARELHAPSCEQPAIFLVISDCLLKPDNVWRSWWNGFFVFSFFGIPIRILAKTLCCSKQTCSMVYGHELMLILRQRNITQWAGGTLFAKIERCMSLHFVGLHISVACQNSVESQREWSGLAQIPVQAKGRSLNTPPPSGPVAATQEGPFPFWHLSETVLGFFPKISGKFSEHFEHFPLLRPRTIHRVSRPSEVFRYFFEHFSLLSERFSEHFEHFPLHFGHFSWHLRPRSCYTFGPLRYNSWNSPCCRTTTCRLSARNLPSTFCGTTPKQATAALRAKRQSSQKIQSRTLSTVTSNEHTSKILKIVWIEPWQIRSWLFVNPTWDFFD